MKKYIVTGASSGVGKAVAKRLLEKGYQVIMIARNYNAMKELLLTYDNAVILEKDLSVKGSGKEIVHELEKKAACPINGVIHCAGIAPLMRIDENFSNKVEEVFQVNLFSLQEIIEGLLNFIGGFSAQCSLIAMSSVTSSRGSNRQAVYGASKAALEMMMSYYANEHRHLRFNTIVSGAIETAMLEELKIKSPGFDEKMKQNYPLGIIPVDEICDLIELLLSDNIRHVSGKSIPIDSGYFL